VVCATMRAGQMCQWLGHADGLSSPLEAVACSCVRSCMRSAQLPIRRLGLFVITRMASLHTHRRRRDREHRPRPRRQHFYPTQICMERRCRTAVHQVSPKSHLQGVLLVKFVSETSALLWRVNCGETSDASCCRAEILGCYIDSTGHACLTQQKYRSHPLCILDGHAVKKV
jgi:hypothetical protein